MALTRLKPARAVDGAADELRAAVLSGELLAGSNLPPERELAKTLGISRLTLRAAIARLESEGLVRAHHGSGVEVLDFATEAGVAVLPYLLESGRPDLVAPFLELRRAVAVEAVAAACVRATDAELDHLDGLASAAAAAPGTAQLARANMDFSRAVAKLAGNLPVLLLLNTVARVYAARPELGAALLSDEAAVRASFPAIVALLRTRDPGVAREAVRTTLEGLDSATLRKIELE